LFITTCIEKQCNQPLIKLKKRKILLFPQAAEQMHGVLAAEASLNDKNKTFFRTGKTFCLTGSKITLHSTMTK